MTKNKIEYVSIDSIRPYEKNPRVNEESVPKVAESIKQFGFLQPIVADNDGVILAGHTRYAASKVLGLSEVPVLYAKDLSDAQAKAYRLADNKVAESSKWDFGFLIEELNDLAEFDFDMSNFGFDTSDPFKRRKSWAHTEKRCGLKRKIKQHFYGEFIFTSFYETGKDGKPITEIKEDRDNVPLFGDNLCDYLERTLGANIKSGNWCILTTPRRRHKSAEFHFATEICKYAAKQLEIPFYEDAFSANNRNRIIPDFKMELKPVETNVIVYDDILTTGKTISTVRQMLIDAEYVTLCVTGIHNAFKGKGNA